MGELRVENLQMHYQTERGPLPAVDGVSFTLPQGKALGIVGESGCGKSSLGMTLLRLLPQNGKVVGGRVLLDGEDILSLPDETFRSQVRWKKLAMVFQGAMNSLNPVIRVGKQIEEAILTHEDVTRAEARERTAELLEMVGIEPSRASQYPHEFSGGMKQRAVIAMALACRPQIVIADEPTTALDVMMQAQVLRAIADLRERLGLSLILVSHDLSVIAQTCDEVAVMYAGRFVEVGPVREALTEPLHPYARGLLRAFPDINAAERQPIVSIPGGPPDLVNPPPGCRFHPRCELADEACIESVPALEEKGASGRRAACFKVPEGVGAGVVAE